METNKKVDKLVSKLENKIMEDIMDTQDTISRMMDEIYSRDGHQDSQAWKDLMVAWEELEGLICDESTGLLTTIKTLKKFSTDNPKMKFTKNYSNGYY